MVIVLSFQGTWAAPTCFLGPFLRNRIPYKMTRKSATRVHLIRNIKRGILLYYSSSHPSTFPPLLCMRCSDSKLGTASNQSSTHRGRKDIMDIRWSCGVQKITGWKLNAAEGRGWQPDTPKNCCWKGCGSRDLIWMEGGWALPLWKMMEFVSWDDEIPNWMEKWSKCSKPPTREYLWISRNSSCGIFPSESDCLHCWEAVASQRPFRVDPKREYDWEMAGRSNFDLGFVE